MNIAFVINRNYIGPLKTTMYSLYLNNKDESFDAYIFESDLTEKDYSNVKEFFDKINSKVTFCKVDNSAFKDAKKMKSDYSYTTYYKFFIFERLSHLDKVLYLDCDIVVNGNLKDFYYKEYNSLLCAVKDKELMNSNKRHLKRITGSKKNNYFNAGVILFNIKGHEEECIGMCNKLIDFAINNRDILKTHDQDVLNHFFYNKTTFLDKQYNYFTIYKSIFHLIFPISFYKKAKIIHYVGSKPWKKGYVGFYRKTYLKYYKLTSGITDVNYLEKQTLLSKFKHYLIMIRTRGHRFINRLLGL